MTPRTAELSFHPSEDVFEESEASSLDTQVDNVDPPGSRHAFCPTCQKWLNGPTQWEDHRIGKKHLKNTRRAGRAQAETVAPAAAGHPATMTCSEKLEHQHIAGDGNQSKTVKGKYKRRKKNGQAFSDSGYPYDAGMKESRLAYPDIKPLQ